MDIKFFKTQADWRKWLLKNHNSADELWVGFYKKASGKPSITWKQSVDEALCFGWIDGIRKSIDEVSYKIRFTPRRKGSIWSAVNVKRSEELIKLGQMHDSGFEVFNNRDKKKTNRYSFEQKKVKLSAEYENKFKENKKAWEYFQNKSTYYKRRATWWIISAKREETRQRRLSTLIEDSEAGRIIDVMNISKNRN